MDHFFALSIGKPTVKDHSKTLKSPRLTSAKAMLEVKKTDTPNLKPPGCVLPAESVLTISGASVVKHAKPSGVNCTTHHEGASWKVRILGKSLTTRSLHQNYDSSN